MTLTECPWPGLGVGDECVPQLRGPCAANPEIPENDPTCPEPMVEVELAPPLTAETPHLDTETMVAVPPPATHLPVTGAEPALGLAIALLVAGVVLVVISRLAKAQEAVPPLATHYGATSHTLLLHLGHPICSCGWALTPDQPHGRALTLWAEHLDFELGGPPPH